MAAAAAGPESVLNLAEVAIDCFRRLCGTKNVRRYRRLVLTGVWWGYRPGLFGTSRVLVHESLKEQLIKEVCERTKKVTVGDLKAKSPLVRSPGWGLS